MVLSENRMKPGRVQSRAGGGGCQGHALNMLSADKTRSKFKHKPFFGSHRENTLNYRR